VDEHCLSLILCLVKQVKFTQLLRLNGIAMGCTEAKLLQITIIHQPVSCAEGTPDRCRVLESWAILCFRASLEFCRDRRKLEIGVAAAKVRIACLFRGVKTESQSECVLCQALPVLRYSVKKDGNSNTPNTPVEKTVEPWKIAFLLRVAQGDRVATFHVYRRAFSSQFCWMERKFWIGAWADRTCFDLWAACVCPVYHPINWLPLFT